MLSVVVPIFNEINTLPSVLVAVSRVLPEVEKEILLVDDGSFDGTREWIKNNLPNGHRSVSRIRIGPCGNLVCLLEPAATQITVRAIYHDRTRGKGASLKTALAAVTGKIIVIQDADLEYDPIDWTLMYDLIVNQKVAHVVYGSRFQGRRNGRAEFVSFSQAAANWLISALFGFLYRQKLSDIEVCYKMFTKEVSDALNITCADFGCEIQMSAQIARSGRWIICEAAVSYRGRTCQEGKKISWRDGLKALWYLLWFRIRSCSVSANGATQPAAPRAVAEQASPSNPYSPACRQEGSLAIVGDENLCGTQPYEGRRRPMTKLRRRQA